ncbi:MAG TPA: LLM class flavin-dependent oxidoreductase [Mycobacterium sp.]|nr:LLM class flavin-dependent oxidoreductase [Mycobacterium sp.]
MGREGDVVMKSPGVSVGLQIGTQPPLGAARAYFLAARAMRLDSVMIIDHFQSIFPSAIWDRELTWLAAQRPSPHEFFDYQVLLGYLASRAGRLRLGVGVTEVIRRHPVVIAQAMTTLSHLTKRAPILGIGAGERMNIDPYGLDFSEPVTRLEEALQVIRLCLWARGPITFSGKHYRLDRATMDLKPASGRVPEIWIGGHGPRMLRLTGRYGDGWYPSTVVSAQEYEAKLATVRAAAAEAGRNPASIRPALHRFMVVGASEQEARAMLKTKAIRLLGAPLVSDASMTPTSHCSKSV